MSNILGQEPMGNRLPLRGVFNKTIIPLALVGYEMIIANSALATRLVGYLSSHIPSSVDKTWGRPWCRLWPTLWPTIWPTGGNFFF